ncbi:ubiquitin carboxyl-terminal hydrolase [Biomphalaria pfeifferi]|uniref:Ubiquitin carboxyl-terminal hydrolase n=1 Tax=Biomphalaria pfeifferi TaxID=112525 RepID=A0AAD8AMX2_BIOPF|nr:ubiquitin carboxyl-terminal hydrolase [Biomphalaria pfeifferi]
MVVQKKKDNLPSNGLKNKGNTCFFNAAMQCILSIGELNIFYKNTSFPKEKEVSNAFQQFIREYEASGCYDPKSFIDRIGRKIKLFNGSQQDSHEFLIQFFDLLYNELDGSKDKINTKEDFDGVRRANMIARTIFSMDEQSLSCGACDYVSVTTAFKSTILVEPYQTVQMGVDHYYEDVQLEGMGAWKCDKCGAKKHSKKCTDVLAHPEVLIVHISRFHPQGWKNNASVEVDDVLRFSGRRYNLFGVVCHSGSLNGGHYFAEAKRAGTWNLYNDDRVSNGFRTYDGSNPYMLFYTLS